MKPILCIYIKCTTQILFCYHQSRIYFDECGHFSIGTRKKDDSAGERTTKKRATGVIHGMYQLPISLVEKNKYHCHRTYLKHKPASGKLDDWCSFKMNASSGRLNNSNSKIVIELRIYRVIHHGPNLGSESRSESGSGTYEVQVEVEVEVE